ncbi:MAG: hypothetical protein JSV37_06340 [Anaerolineaceae bacterium]|nr:MAG: hypothetical protein JSV37_06340 [Anaerolineaceae bacterium]
MRRHIGLISVLITLFLLMGAFVMHASLFKDWLVDDAGISLAYARNFANGDGLVSQPGVKPVEGFSNPLWVFILSSLGALGFNLPLVVKPLSISLTLISIALLFFASRMLLHSSSLASLVTGLLVVQPAFVIWSVSGLENPLYILLILLLFIVSLQTLSKRIAVLAGCLAAAIAITRPEGILYAIAFPVLHRRLVKAYLAPLLLLLSGFLAFRFIYFGDLLPNTYYMKMQGGFLSWNWLLEQIYKSYDLADAFWGGARVIVFIGLASSVVYLARAHGIYRNHWIVFLFVAISLISFYFLPSDWMGEYRLASPIFPFVYLLIAMILLDVFLISKVRHRDANLILGGILGAWLLVGAVAVYLPRSRQFSQEPTVSFWGVSADFKRFEVYSESLDLTQVSVLLPDVGGPLYDFHLRVYDLAGLTDSTIARTINKNQEAFYDYVFDMIRPTFIHLHGKWTYLANLEADPRFRRDYLPINEYEDRYVKSHHNMILFSGDFVRRDVLQDPRDIDLLREE